MTDKTIYTIRRHNLQERLRHDGKKAELARRLGTEPSHVTHLVTEPGGRRQSRLIHEDKARQIEEVMGWEKYALDTDPAVPSMVYGLDTRVLKDTLVTLSHEVSALGVILNIEQSAEVICAIYGRSRFKKEVDPLFVRALLQDMMN